jgi:PEP-CTERM/exosortase A-associated glycosyltransferase
MIGVPKEKLTIIPNAVNYKLFDESLEPDINLREQLGLDGKKVLGFIGSFYAYEGLTVLLKSLPLILEKQPEMLLLLVGGGPDENNLRRLVSDLGLKSKVIFTGRVPHEQVPNYYDLVDVLVYPRISMRLTELVTPLKPLEAMARGRLVLASDVGGHRELIKDKETGFLFSAGDPESLAETVEVLFKNQESWPVVCQTARKFVEEERNWTISVDRYQQVYDNVIKK